MIHFIERIRDYFTRKDCADMAIRNWKSANEELYANFCKRMDAVEKGNLSVLTDMYQMMRECTPPEALLLYNWLSELEITIPSSCSKSGSVSTIVQMSSLIGLPRISILCTSYLSKMVAATFWVGAFF